MLWSCVQQHDEFKLAGPGTKYFQVRLFLGWVHGRNEHWGHWGPVLSGPFLRFCFGFGFLKNEMKYRALLNSCEPIPMTFININVGTYVWGPISPRPQSWIDVPIKCGLVVTSMAQSGPWKHVPSPGRALSWFLAGPWGTLDHAIAHPCFEVWCTSTIF